MDPDDLMTGGDYFGMDDCELTNRRGEKSRPYVGQGVWLTPYVSSAILEAAGGMTTGNAGDQARAIGDMRHAIAGSVLRHNLVDVDTGEDLAQFWGDPEAVQLPAVALFHLYQLIVTGEAPAERPKDLPDGRAGTTTPTSSAPKIRRSPVARPRQRSG